MHPVRDIAQYRILRLYGIEMYTEALLSEMPESEFVFSLNVDIQYMD